MYYYSLYYIFWDELIGSRSGKKIRIRIQIRKTVTIPQQQCFRKVFAINMESALSQCAQCGTKKSLTLVTTNHKDSREFD